MSEVIVSVSPVAKAPADRVTLPPGFVFWLPLSVTV